VLTTAPDLATQPGVPGEALQFTATLFDHRLEQMRMVRKHRIDLSDLVLGGLRRALVFETFWWSPRGPERELLQVCPLRLHQNVTLTLGGEGVDDAGILLVHGWSFRDVRDG
jgi:hypothetical protein